MSDENALLGVIAAQLDEDTPRLAYADWLDEYAGDLADPELARAHAELIRVQVERVRCPYWLPGYTDRYAELGRREEEIRTRFAAAILGPAAGSPGVEVSFSRGFPYLRMTANTFLEVAERIEQLRPPVLTVTDAAEHWYDLVTHPLFPLVTNLAMRAAWVSVPGLWLLNGAIVGQLGQLGTHNRLRGLDLRGCRVGDGGLFHLAEHAAVWRLEDLDLSHNDIQFVGLVELLGTSVPHTLRRVNLCGNPIADLGARTLAERWPANGPLKWLRLEGTLIGPSGRDVLRARFGDKVEFGPAG